MIRIVAHIVIAALIGAVLALVALYLFFHGPLVWLNLVVWALVAGIIGFSVSTWRLSILDSAIVGFAIVFSYSILGYQGAGSLLAAIPVFALIAVAGAAGTAAMGALGHLVRTRLRPASAP
jgi:hypothetical protein